METRPARPAAALPRGIRLVWTKERNLSRRSRETGDPLGFRAVAGRAAPDLVPIFTRGCDSVRQLSITMLLLEFAHSETGELDPRERFLRGERLWLLAVARDERDDRRSGVSWAGITWARATRRRAVYELDGDGALRDQLSSGLWGQTRRPAALLGLIDARPGSPRSGPEGWRLTPLGRQLASAARDGVARENAHLARAVTSRQVRDAQLDGWFAPGWATGFAHDRQGADGRWRCLEVDVMSTLLRRTEQAPAFAALHRTWRAAGESLTLSMRRTGDLLEEQRSALATLRAVDRLARRIEKPYRRWLEDPSLPFDRTVVDDAGWTRLKGMGEPEMERLAAALEESPGWETVQRHHQWLAGIRGAPPWRPESDLKVPPYRRIETRLPSIGKLFEEGVDPTEEDQ